MDILIPGRGTYMDRKSGNDRNRYEKWGYDKDILRVRKMWLALHNANQLHKRKGKEELVNIYIWKCVCEINMKHMDLVWIVNMEVWLGNRCEKYGCGYGL